MSLFAELKRQNVFRMGGAYLARGWVVTQVTATVEKVSDRDDPVIFSCYCPYSAYAAARALLWEYKRVYRWSAALQPGFTAQRTIGPRRGRRDHLGIGTKKPSASSCAQTFRTTAAPRATTWASSSQMNLPSRTCQSPSVITLRTDKPLA